MDPSDSAAAAKGSPAPMRAMAESGLSAGATGSGGVGVGGRLMMGSVQAVWNAHSTATASQTAASSTTAGASGAAGTASGAVRNGAAAGDAIAAAPPAPPAAPTAWTSASTSAAPRPVVPSAAVGGTEPGVSAEALLSAVEEETAALITGRAQSAAESASAKVGIDVRALQKELSTAVSTERRRVAVDEMKKRAIHSAPSYDDFANLVKCAEDDLKPLGAGESFVLQSRQSVGLNEATRGGSSVAPAVMGSTGTTSFLGTIGSSRAAERAEADRLRGEALRKLGERVAAKAASRAGTDAEGGATGSVQAGKKAGKRSGKSGKGKWAQVDSSVTATHSTGYDASVAGGTSMANAKVKAKTRAKAAAAEIDGGDKLPKTANAFTRQWRKSGPSAAQQYAFVMRIPPARLARVFKTEIDGALLAQIVSACNACFGSLADAAAGSGASGAGAASAASQPAGHGSGEGDAATAATAPSKKSVPPPETRQEEAAQVVAVLGAIAQAGRFALTVDLQTASERAVAVELFAKLAAASGGKAPDALERTAALYTAE